MDDRLARARAAKLQEEREALQLQDDINNQAERLHDADVTVENLTARLASAIHGTAEYFQLQRQRAQTLNRRDLEAAKLENLNAQLALRDEIAEAEQVGQVTRNPGGRPTGPSSDVSNRIAEIRQHNTQGLTDAQIAQKLSISRGYVCQLRRQANIPRAKPPARMKKEVDVKT